MGGVTEADVGFPAVNRFEYCHPDNNSDNDSFGSFLSKNRIFCNITRC